MSLLQKVVKGKIKKPIFMCIYGQSGIGKTTFAASAPTPLFLATEEGTNELDVARLKVDSWEEMDQALSELLETSTEYQTLAIDSLDHLEVLIHKRVAEDNEKENIESIGYAKGYIFALDYWKTFLNKLSAIRDKYNKNIILISHAHVKSFTDPHHNETYDRFELKMHRKASDLIKETVDMLVFAKQDIAFKKDEKQKGKVKAFDMERRVLYTELEAAFDAKNRYGLPPQIEFPAQGAFDLVQESLDRAHGENAESFERQIAELLKRVKDETVLEKAKESFEQSKGNLPMLKKIYGRLETITKE